MVTIDQAMRGIVRFVDTEILPHLPTGKGIGAGIMIALIMDGGKERIIALRENPVVQMMGIMDEAGNINIDRLYNAARPKFEQRLPVSIPFIGELTFDQNDVDKLYRYMKEAA